MANGTIDESVTVTIEPLVPEDGLSLLQLLLIGGVVAVAGLTIYLAFK